MPISGSLSLFTMSDLLQWIGAGAISGELRVARDGEDFVLWFERGRLDGLSASREDLRFGRMLVRERIVTEDRLGALLGGPPLGRRLVDEALVSEVEATRLLRRHALDASSTILAWADGTFEFKKVRRTTKDGVGMSLPAEEMLLEGHRRLDERNRAA